ncbi:hypothetical protein [Moraxella lacunata]|uniref:hypothetical protein n=1 Tax=Moraxella lacunata TaxID=477 RepID=UPI003EDF2DF0
MGSVFGSNAEQSHHNHRQTHNKSLKCEQKGHSLCSQTPLTIYHRFMTQGVKTKTCYTHLKTF